jgi:hypothetical protein
MLPIAVDHTVLKLHVAPGQQHLSANSVDRALKKYMGPEKPYDGILLNLLGVRYRLSSADLTVMLFAIRPQGKKQLLPCALVADGATAESIRAILKITQLDELDHILVVGSESEGLAHIGSHIAQDTV